MSEPSAMADMKICPAKQRLQRGGTEKEKLEEEIRLNCLRSSRIVI